MSTVPYHPAERRFRAFRHHLVLQLARKTGPYWDAISEVRAAWDISPIEDVPPGTWGMFVPEACEGIASFDAHDYSPKAMEVSEACECWEQDLFWIHETIVPEEYRIGKSGPYALASQSFEHWARFISACVVYDPPPDRLVAFANAYPQGPPDWLDPDGPLGVENRRALLAPEIRILPDTDRIEELEHWHHDEVIGRLAERLAPQGINIRRMVLDIESELSDEYWHRRLEMSEFPYIAVFRHTTRDAVERARRLILDEVLSSEELVGPRQGRPRRNPLESEEVAHLRSLHTEAEVAKLRGWPLAEDEYGRARRSSRVRRHLADSVHRDPLDQILDE